MTQYFHARGKLLHFKLEGGDRERRKEAEEEWNKSAGIKGLMRGGRAVYRWWEKAKREGYSVCQRISLTLALKLTRHAVSVVSRWSHYYTDQYCTGLVDDGKKTCIYTSIVLNTNVRRCRSSNRSNNIFHLSSPSKTTLMSVYWSDAKLFCQSVPSRRGSFPFPSLLPSFLPSFFLDFGTIFFLSLPHLKKAPTLETRAAVQFPSTSVVNVMRVKERCDGEFIRTTTVLWESDCT